MIGYPCTVSTFQLWVDCSLTFQFDQHLPEAFAGFDLTPFTHIGRWMKQLRSELVGYEEVFAPVVEMATKTKAAAAARASKL